MAIRKEVTKEAPDPKKSTESFKPMEGSKEVLIDPDNLDGKVVRIGTTLSSNREALSSTSSGANKDIFAWKPSNMPGIPREVTEHELKIRPGSKPVKQRMCRFDEEKRRAFGEEIAKLLAAEFIKEV